MKRVGEMWNEMTDAEKQPFVEQAEEDKKR